MSQNFNVIKKTGLYLRTSDAAANVIGSQALLPSKTYTIRASVVAARDTLTESGGYSRAATFRTSAAGVITQVGTTTSVATHEDDSTWDVAFAVSGSNVNLVVTGNPGKIINWRADIETLAVGFDADAT